MSASEKLKGLDAAATPSAPNPWKYELDRGDYRVRVLAPAGMWVEIPYDQSDATLIAQLRNALPQIVAVVEAAEAVRGDTPWTSKSQLDAALSALEEELT